MIQVLPRTWRGLLTPASVGIAAMSLGFTLPLFGWWFAAIAVAVTSSTGLLVSMMGRLQIRSNDGVTVLNATVGRLLIPSVAPAPSEFTMSMSARRLKSLLTRASQSSVSRP
jgi:hypothetical protein